jgi:VIT1/CCC1 family predicted Fe2+/Mn2+ transporter
MILLTMNSLHSPHAEHHFTGNQTLRDIVLGMADGLTVPFALAAGLSGALVASKIVVAAGLAEISAGAIAMGLGGYLAAKSDAEHYAAERAREEEEVDEKPEVEALEVKQILQTYGLASKESEAVVGALRQRRQAWIDFMMRFELGLEEPDPARALQSGVTIGGSYIVGGLVPLAPYFFMGTAAAAFRISVGVTLSALLIFGFIKGRFTGARPVKSAIQTLVIGGMAATAAFMLAKAVS